MRRLLNQDVIQHIKCKGKDKSDPSLIIYHQGKPADYFVLILEGRVEVTVGQESLVFECGPFTFFGTQALAQNVGLGKYFSFPFLMCNIPNLFAFVLYFSGIQSTN